MTGPGAVVFDLDGVLIDSEALWDDARRQLAAEHAIAWPADATAAMMGMSSPEWSRYLHDAIGVPLAPADISRRVVAGLERRYRERLPLIDGAASAVERVAARWPLGLASSANRELIDLVLDAPPFAGRFRVAVSAEEVARGKPAPDVYLEAARRLGVPPVACVAVEDSANGLRAAHAAGMAVLAIPNRTFPPSADALALADAVIGTITALDPDLVLAAARRR
jgi:HAD superfamily hydrolase (TIGR01509 family)